MEKKKLGPGTHLYPKPAVLVGAMVDGKPNFMTVAWCGVACNKPPSLSVAIAKKRYTLEGIDLHGAFSVNVPSADLAQKVDYCGVHSGRKTDKSEIFKVAYGALETAPLVEECPLNFECKVLHSLELGSHFLIVGEVVETHIDGRCLTDGKPDVCKLDPLIYASGSMQYHRLGEAVGKAFHIGKEM